MKYCQNCIMPETRPDQYLNNNGLCNACTSFKKIETINWEERKKELLKTIDSFNLDGAVDLSLVNK